MKTPQPPQTLQTIPLTTLADVTGGFGVNISWKSAARNHKRVAPNQ
jgi:hypothetical protein